jgi:hypothetical protein
MMKSIDTRQVLEYIGVIVLIMSVAFLGYELKRSNEIAEAVATSNSYQSVNAFLYSLLADRELLRVWNAGNSNIGALD